MEQVNEVVGYPGLILLEKIFWLGLGCFFGLAIINSLLRKSKGEKNQLNPVSDKELEKLAKKAVQQNPEINDF